MKYQLFSAAFILLMGVSLSQDMEVPCRKDADCQHLANAPQQVICSNFFCKCPDASGKVQNCASLNVTSLSEQQQANSPATVVGRFCTMDKDCTAGDVNSFCNTTRKQCDCHKNFVTSEDHMHCLPSVMYRDAGCEIDKQCLASTANTTCSAEKICVCAANHHYDTNACWASKAFGTPCSVTAECRHVQESVCDNGNLCTCPIDRVIDPNSTACLRIASKIEDDCIESIQCTQLLGEGGICAEKQCRCRENYHHSSVAFKCLPNLDLGAKCNVSYECSNGEQDGGHGPMQCLNNQCACAEGFTNIGGKCEAILRKPEEGANSAASRLGDVASFVMALAYFVILSAIL